MVRYHTQRVGTVGGRKDSKSLVGKPHLEKFDDLWLVINNENARLLGTVLSSQRHGSDPLNSFYLLPP